MDNFWVAEAFRLRNALQCCTDGANIHRAVSYQQALLTFAEYYTEADDCESLLKLQNAVEEVNEYLVVRASAF